MKQSDQCLYLTNCTPTPPLTQLQSTDNKLGLMLGQGRGKNTVVHILTLIQALFLGSTHKLTLQLPDKICNSPYCQPYNSSKVSSEN